MSYIYSAAQIIVNLLYVPILLSGIGQSEYGLYQMIGSIVAYMNVISGTLSAGATRYYCKYYVLGDEDGMANTLGILKRIYRWATLGIAGFAFIAAIVLSFVYAQSFTQQEITESCLMLAILALNLVVTMNNTISIAVITAHEDFVFLKGSMLATVILQPLLVIFFIRLFPYALTVSIVQLFANSLCRSIQHWYAKKHLGMDSKLRWLDKKLEKGILTFSGGIVLGFIADQIFWKTDQLILGYFFGPSLVAVYAVGSQIVNAYMPLGTSISSVFFSRASDLWNNDHSLEEMSALFTKVSRIALYPLLAVLIGFIVFGQEFIFLWAGPGYSDAYWVAVIELTPFTVDVAQNIGLNILQVMNRYGFRAKMYLAAALFNIVLTIILAPQYGCIGAAVSSGIAILLSSGFILNWYYQKRIHLNMGAYWKSVIRESIPLIILGVLGKMIWSATGAANWGILILGICLFAVAFSLTAYFFSANEYEKSMVRGIVKKLIPSK